MFSGGIERRQCQEMDYKSTLETFDLYVKCVETQSDVKSVILS